MHFSLLLLFLSVLDWAYWLKEGCTASPPSLGDPLPLIVIVKLVASCVMTRKQHLGEEIAGAKVVRGIVSCLSQKLRALF